MDNVKNKCGVKKHFSTRQFRKSFKSELLKRNIPLDKAEIKKVQGNIAKPVVYNEPAVGAEDMRNYVNVIVTTSHQSQSQGC
jgi:hypothetical protein